MKLLFIIAILFANLNVYSSNITTLLNLTIDEVKLANNEYKEREIERIKNKKLVLKYKEKSLVKAIKDRVITRFLLKWSRVDRAIESGDLNVIIEQISDHEMIILLTSHFGLLHKRKSFENLNDQTLVGIESSNKGYYFTHLKDFYMDGCSWFPDGLSPGKSKKANKWMHCCLEHDLLYFAGGPKSERKSADHELKVCLKESGHGIIGLLMEAGVRFGGNAHLPTAFRWGYGWPKARKYISVVSLEREWIDLKFENYNCYREMQDLSNDPIYIDKICNKYFNKIYR